ncbi:TPA: BRO-N domain-containing protein [Flavobacterium psychrophilum]
MSKENVGPVQTINEQNEIMTFNFSESKNEIRNLLLDNKVWFIAKDVCDALGIVNNRQAIRELDDDEKLTYKLYTSGQNRNTSIISESGLYALILRSNKPYARTFRKWITSEVIPTILKKGFYSMNSKKNDDFIDARDIPYTQVLFNETPVKTITINEIAYYSLNDYHIAIKSRTSSGQASKKLNKVTPLAVKIWLFGSTNPAWFTSLQGLQLIASGSRVFNSSNQLTLSI